MAENRENSVLFSLRELRTIEEERIQEEQDAAKQAEEDRIRAQMDAERRVREEAEAARLAQETAERTERERAETAAREERIRVEEAERKARVEAQANIERERLAKEMEIRAVEASKKRPTVLIVAVSLLVLVVGGLGFVYYKNQQEADKQLAAERAAREAQAKEVAQLTSDIDKLIQEKDKEVTRLLAAKTDQEKKAAQAALDEKNVLLAKKREQLRAAKELKVKRDIARKKRRDRDKLKVKCDPNDPLCGI